jgi:opacity protein-like surface antigen
MGLSGGINILDDSALINANSIDIEYDPGFQVGGVLGYDFGMWRLDAEVAYRTNAAGDLILPPPFGGFPADGSTSALSYMINGYFDIPTNMLIKPYLGGGIGYATVSLDATEPSVLGPVADDSDSVLAYQLSTGLGFDISKTTTLSLGYRSFATEDLEMVTIGVQPFTTEYQSHEFNIGVRFLFH